MGAATGGPAKPPDVDWFADKLMTQDVNLSSWGRRTVKGGQGLGAVRWESRTEGRKQNADRAQLRDGHTELWWGWQVSLPSS